MLKKSKRTLSLVLALIMICSAMSIMAFAAENSDGTVYEFSGSRAITLETTSDMGTTCYTTCTIYVEGSWHPGDGSFCWLTSGTYCNFSGALSENFWSSRVSSLTSNTLIWDVYYEENNDEAEHVYTIQVIFDEDESLSVKCYKINGLNEVLYASTTISAPFREA